MTSTATEERSNASKALLLPGWDSREQQRVVSRSTATGAMVAILVVAASLRVWRLDAVGFNSDEAVYAGQAASLAGDIALQPFFPVFRAHPLLFQTALALIYEVSRSDIAGRALAAAFGVGTVAVTYGLARTLYGRRIALVAAGLLAVMPYHVSVSRQVLLDTPMVFFATVTLYLAARYGIERRPVLLYAMGAAQGLTFLSKETSIVLVGSIWAFLALSPEVRVRIRHLVGSLAVMFVTVLPFPAALSLSGRTKTGGNYLAWQLFRRPNHGLLFYPATVPSALGWFVVAMAIIGAVVLWHRRSWREILLVAWIAVPCTFFELWPVKGYQYLLPIAPAVAVLAARPLGDARWLPAVRGGAELAARVSPVLLAVVVLSLVLPSWQFTHPADGTTFLAGTGGLPGGREAGQWIDSHTPLGARFLTVGPSMANLVQFYGGRKANGLAVSPNPLHRNPSYEPVGNPDLLIRTNDVQYLVWDAYSAARSPFFAAGIQRYVDRYNGRVVHIETTARGQRAIVIYEVRP